jgi:hypothetical protein
MLYNFVKFSATDGTTFITNITTNTVVTTRHLWNLVREVFDKISDPNIRIVRRKANVEVLETTSDKTQVDMQLNIIAKSYDAIAIYNEPKQKILQRVRVCFYDLDGVLVHQFATISEAAQVTGICKSKINYCNKNNLIYQGFKIVCDKSYRERKNKRIVNIYDKNFNFLYSGTSQSAGAFVGAQAITTINGAVGKYILFDKYIVTVGDITDAQKEYFTDIMETAKLEAFQKSAALNIKKEAFLNARPYYYVYDETKSFVMKTQDSKELVKIFRVQPQSVRLNVFNNKSRLTKKLKGFYISKTRYYKD